MRVLFQQMFLFCSSRKFWDVLLTECKAVRTGTHAGNLVCFNEPEVRLHIYTIVESFF